MDQSLSLSSASATASASAFRTHQQQQVRLTVFNLNTPTTTSFLNPKPLTLTRVKTSTGKRKNRSSCNRLLLIRSSSYHHYLTSSSSSAVDYIFRQAFISQLDSFHTSFLLASTALTLAGTLFYTRHRNVILQNEHNESEIGDWNLFASPTPFNRFLNQRCPSLHHNHSGRIPYYPNHVLEHNVEYQRRCVNAPDGGVVSLDWPSCLDQERDGFDTTILIVPGTSEGSSDPNVTSFVNECLNRGCFPVVVNPRGAARSPLTTPRLFTPADSDDIGTAVDFVSSRARPWTTLMAVGFGYGANMLTKYLAEVGEDTPLTAAVCLDNPFDLSVCRPNEQKLTRGFVEILQSNKELFQGRSKGFDVEKALQAKSLHDFEEAISMVSYGFNTLEEFHTSSSTRDVVGNVKIPLLFIQDNAAPSSSIPSSSIAENPYTSLLTCTFRSDDRSITGTSAVTWCQHLVVEWLTAVELGLLKGRHPLLEDTDVTINPSKSLKLIPSKASDASSRSNNLLNLRQLDSSNGNASYPSEKMLKRSDEYVNSSSGLDLQNNTAENKGINGAVTQTNVVGSEVVKEGDVHLDLQTNIAEDKGINGAVTPTNVVGSEVVNEGDVDLVDAETGQVVRATEVVMNMLDVTMPDTLSEEQKLKVRTAVAQGETLMTALQGAVPEDVRGKLTSSVTAILQNQKKNSNGVPSVSNVSDVTSALNPKIQETSEPNASELNKRDTSSAEDSTKPSTKKDASEPQAQTSGTGDSSQVQSTSKEREPKASELDKGDTSSAEDSNKPSTKNDASEPQAYTSATSDSSQVQSTGREKELNASELNKGSSAEDPNKSSTKNDASEPQAPTLGTGDSSKVQSTSSATKSHDEMGSGNQNASDLNESNSSPPGKPERSAKSEDHTSELAKLGHEDGTKVEKDNQPKDAQPEKSIPTPKTEESPSPSSSSPPEKDNQPKDAQPEKSIPPPKTEESSSPSSSSPPEKDNQPKDAQPEKSIPTPKSEESSSASSSSPPENPLMEKEDGANQKKEESSAQPVPVPSNTNSGSPSFGVSQALDAITGMDDSTQLAVNSVFSVIEDVITQLEGNGEGDSAIADKDKIADKDTDPESKSDLQQNGNGAINMKTEPKELSNLSVSNLSSDKKDEATVFENDRNDIQRSITELPYRNPQSHHLSNMKTKLLSADSDTSLSIDYVPKEGQRKLLEQSGDGLTYVDDSASHEGIDVNVKRHLPSDVECKDDIIEPAYVILDTERDEDPVEEPQVSGDASVVLMQLIKENILNALKVEVCRRIQATDMEDIATMLKKELEEVANTISLAVVHDKQLMTSWDGDKFGDLQAEHIIDVISSAVERTTYMKEVVPVGIVVGSSLASLRKSFNIVAEDSTESTEVVRDHSQEGDRLQADWVDADEMPFDKVKQSDGFYSEDEGYSDEDVSSSLTSDTVMVGAVTAAIGASALYVHQQGTFDDGLDGFPTSSMSNTQKENHQETSKSSDDNIVTSLAEKAMSVAAPVLPTKEGGGVDQDRLVTLLADLGQRGGILRLVGKLALLWGGIRGAMSLIVKLITFLRLSERPLYQRILGFVSLVLVLWTPVVVPLLPTLVQNLAENNSSKFAVLACIIGLYSSVMILIALWGQRIRGYEYPLKKYGLELTSAKQIQKFFYGLIGGVMLVFFIQSANVLVGSVSVSWPTIPSSTDAVTLLKLFGKGLLFIGQGLLTTASVALVEEMLFRSWLPEEIAVDLGFNQGIILSGLAFSLCQWSPKAIPGLWLLSMGLAGVRQRCQGSLSVPIGLRTGIMASSFVLKEGGFLIHHPTNPLWLSGGGDPFQPFSSTVGLAVAILWALILYPRKPQRNIKE